jgi:exodeoxyribonuclease-3
MIIATWNVNSVKSRLEHLVKYLREKKPDVVLLQELKCQTDAFPYMEVEECGYNLAIHGQKTYNGVAILSKHPIEDIITTLPGEETDEAARYIEAFTNGYRVVSVYVPNGIEEGSDKFQYKLRFFNRLREHFKALLQYDEKLVVGGDFNVAPNEIDVYDPVGMNGSICFHPLERNLFRSILNLGLTESFRTMHPGIQKFSWWDYRAGAWQYNKGMRIDHILLSAEAADKLVNADIDSEPRSWDKPSDHTPVWVELGK